jgi:hypothetical protein
MFSEILQRLARGFKQLWKDLRLDIRNNKADVVKA